MMKKPLFAKLRKELCKGLSLASLDSASSVFNGYSFRVPLINGVGASNLIINDQWMCHFVSEASREKRGKFLDIGANVGLFLIMTQSQRAQNPYIGIDPNPLCIHYINELIRINNINNASAYCLALGDRTTNVRFYASRKGDKMGSIFNDMRINQNHRKIFSYDVLMMNALDFLQKTDNEEVAAIKIDVEGAEYYVLKDLLPLLEERKPWVFCEISPRLIGEGSSRKRSQQHVAEMLHKVNYVAISETGVSLQEDLVEPVNFVFLPNSEKELFRVLS